MAPFFALVMLLFVATTTRPAISALQALRVRAEAKIVELSVVPDGTVLVIRFRLVDELANPVSKAPLTISLGTGTTLSFTGCASSAAPERIDTGFRVRTDRHGAACVRLDGAALGVKATLSYAGDDYYDGTVLEATLEPQRARVRLSFDQPVLEIPLERPTVPVWISALADHGAPFGAPVHVVLLHRASDAGDTVQIAAGDIHTGDRAHLDVETKALSMPGPGTLVARHAGSATTEPSEATALIRRTATVTLSLARPPRQVTQGAEVELQLGASSGVGAVPDGWIEALHEDRPVGTAEVRKGSARLLAQVDGPRSGEVELVVRYIPKDPWWVPGDPLTVSVPIAAPSAWTRLPWVLAVCGIAYWIIRAWRRPGRSRKARPPSSKVPVGRADVAVVSEGPADAGWTGHVLDAHDGTPIAGAQVQLLLPAFDGEGVAASTRTDETGAFALRPLGRQRPEGARLQVTALHHSRLIRPIPPPGQVVVSMVARRRTVLELLVNWARARGRPWIGSSDPTPAEVAALARRRNESETITWARAVEEAAYGPWPPDEAREDDLRRREPRATSGGPEPK